MLSSKDYPVDVTYFRINPITGGDFEIRNYEEHIDNAISNPIFYNWYEVQKFNDYNLKRYLPSFTAFVWTTKKDNGAQIKIMLPIKKYTITLKTNF